ncbi:MAG: SMC-Scp complex subunit ScpB [Planctomycetaceae bacterium]|jgi:segregation and condensation protein B|nr:SMC-Scp complex subunit ScpB [Planctomycetaceae bacterium]
MKKSNKKNFTLTDNTDSADGANNSVNIIVTENTSQIVADKSPKQISEMCRKLGAKYYAEDIVGNDDGGDGEGEGDNETIFSLESLRDIFLAVKSSNSSDTDRRTISTGKTDNSNDRKNIINTESNTGSNVGSTTGLTVGSVEELSDVYVLESDWFDDVEEKVGVNIDIAVGIDEVEVEVDEVGGVDLDQEEILEGGVGGDDVGVMFPVSPESILEAMLFVGNRDNNPLTAERAAEKMRNVQPNEIDEIIKSLNSKYDLIRTPYKIVEEGSGGYRMVLREEFASIQEKFYGKIREAKLSQGAIDILAIIAYKQPITAEEIQNLRKQPSAGLISQLVRRGLIQLESEIRNKKKKIFYKTTKRFLELFQLDSIDDLPVAEDF